jgi:CRP/FNR family transcriptional regulator, cyclic AMP receptor protein
MKTLVEFLRAVPLFSEMPPEDLEHLQSLFVEKTFHRNQTILAESDTHEFMYVVRSGKVKVIKINNAGKENILAIHRAGEFFGEMSLLDGKTSPATVKALEDSKIIFVRKEDFLKHLLKDERILRQVINVLCTRLRESWDKIQTLTHSDAEGRIRKTLDDLAAKHGVEDSRGTIINVKLTHMELAEMAGTSRETVTRILDRYEDEGKIDVIDHKVIILRAS